MDETLVNFIGSVGPGQVVDRHSLAVLPVGFLKIGICNDVNDLRLLIDGFRESLEEANLSLKLSVKASLHTGGGILDGATSVCGRDYKTMREVTVIRFDKSAVVEGPVPELSDCYVTKWKDETLQIVVHAWRRGGRMRSKSRLGFVYIRLNDVTRTRSQKFNLESWYKVFPYSSVFFGSPTNELNSCYVNSPSSSSSTSLSPVSPEALELAGSLEFPSTSSSSYEAAIGNLPKNTSFKNVARALVKLMRKRKDSPGDEAASKDLEEQKTQRMRESRFANQRRGWQSLPEKLSFMKVTNPGTSNASRRQPSKFENIIKLKLRPNLSKSSSFNTSQSKFKRCEEIICSSPSPGEVRKLWGVHSENQQLSFDYTECRVESIHNNLLETNVSKRGLLRNDQQNSIESGRSSSVDTDDAAAFQNRKVESGIKYLKIISSMHTWARRVQNKTKFRSPPPLFSPPFFEDTDYGESEHVYDVLKRLQTIEKTSSSRELLRNQPSSSSKAGSSEFQNERSNEEKSNETVEMTLSSATSTSASPNPVAPSPSAAALSPESLSEYEVERRVSAPGSTTCRSRREKFARNRSLAIERLDHAPLALAAPSSSPELDSEDDFVTCCADDDALTCPEQLRSSNVSVTSLYTTASEQEV